MLGNLSGETRLFPIIGDPIIFVKIPPLLTGDLEARGHNGICVPMQVPETDLEGVMNGLSRIPNIDGLLITMPHKFTAFAYCATSSERYAPVFVYFDWLRLLGFLVFLRLLLFLIWKCAEAVVGRERVIGLKLGAPNLLQPIARVLLSFVFGVGTGLGRRENQMVAGPIRRDADERTVRRLLIAVD